MDVDTGGAFGRRLNFFVSGVRDDLVGGSSMVS